MLRELRPTGENNNLGGQVVYKYDYLTRFSEFDDWHYERAVWATDIKAAKAQVTAKLEVTLSWKDQSDYTPKPPTFDVVKRA